MGSLVQAHPEAQSEDFGSRFCFLWALTNVRVVVLAPFYYASVSFVAELKPILKCKARTEVLAFAFYRFSFMGSRQRLRSWFTPKYIELNLLYSVTPPFQMAMGCELRRSPLAVWPQAVARTSCRSWSSNSGMDVSSSRAPALKSIQLPLRS